MARRQKEDHIGHKLTTQTGSHIWSIISSSLGIFFSCMFVDLILINEPHIHMCAFLKMLDIKKKVDVIFTR